MEINKIFRRIMYVQWASVAVSAILQLTWLVGTNSMDSWHAFSLVALGALLLTAAAPIDKLNPTLRVVLLLVEILLATFGMVLGVHRMFGLVFLVIAGKIAIILEKRSMWVVAVFLLVTHTVASSYIRTHYAVVHGGALPLNQQTTNLLLLETQLFFLCAMTIALLFGRTLLSEYASRRAAEKLAREIESMAQAVERGRIARDMHDTIGHSLTSLNIQLELTSKLLESGDKQRAEASLNLAREAARTSLEDVRNTVRSVRDEDFSLKQSVAALTERIGQQQDISFAVKIDEQNLSPPCRHNLLMIMQECLTNIQKHSGASQVTIELDASQKEAHLTVKDNGRGFSRDASGTGCGIKGIEERAISLGGVVDIKSRPGAGTAIMVTLPT